MTTKTKIVLSASRRTDIPAFYMPWFMERIRQGFFEVINPFNQRLSIVPATPHEVHTIVFWSKNFGPFIEKSYGERLRKQGFNLFFNFTINSDSKMLEPNVPPLTERLKQLKHLCEYFGSEAIHWRFDPICFFKTDAGPVQNNSHDFNVIAERAAALGITRCITSFMDHYPKILKRLKSRPQFEFVDPPLSDKVKVILELEAQLKEHHINLYTCCEKEVIESLPSNSSVSPSSCIPNDLLLKIYSGNLSLKKDTGQRVKAGCGCKVSTDIGSYRHQPCYHNCLFCYANPTSGFGS